MTTLIEQANALTTPQLIERMRAVTYPQPDDERYTPHAEQVARLCWAAADRLEEVTKPTHYWTDVCEDFAVDDLEQIVNEQWIDMAGSTFEATPLHAMPKVYYGVIPDGRDTDAEWADGEYCGDLIVIGPYATEQEARAKAKQLTESSAALSAKGGDDA